MELTRRSALKTGTGALMVAATAGYATAQSDDEEATLELLAEENIDHQHACLHGDFDDRTSLEAGELDGDSPTVDDTHVIWEVTYEGDQRYVVFDADAHFADGPFVFYTADGSVTAVEGTELERGDVDDEEYCDSLDEYVEVEPEDGSITLELVADLADADDPDGEDEADDEDENGEETGDEDDGDEPDDEDEADEDDGDEPDDEDEAEDDGDEDGEEDDEDEAEDDEDESEGEEDDEEDSDDESEDEDDGEDDATDEDGEADEDESEADEDDEDEDTGEDLELSVSGPDDVSTGESAQFHATVRNRGDAGAEITVSLEVGSQSDSTSVDLDAGSCRGAWLCADAADLSAGDYDWTVTAGDEVATGTLTVAE